MKLGHDNMMAFTLKAMGMEQSAAAEELSMSMLNEAFKDLPLFGAGEVRHKHPNAFAHGDIEAIALKGAGFREEEIKQVYYGNWLRDWSQVVVADAVGFDKEDRELLRNRFGGKPRIKDLLPTMPHKPSQKTWTAVIRCLAVKEFIYNPKKEGGIKPTQVYSGHLNEFERLFGKLDEDTLGIYRPEEHIDNPKGLEDDSPLSNSSLKQPVVFMYERPSGKSPQIFYKGTIASSLEINPTTNMKRYIREDLDSDRPSSLTYFNEQMQLAVSKGRNRDGFRHFGAALHVLEDYFAHTNFVEISLIKMGYLKVFPWVQLTEEAKKMTNGFEKASVTPVVTGFFGKDDAIASIAPKVRDEFFPLESEEFVALKPGERTFFDSIFLTILQDLSAKQDKNEAQILDFSYSDILQLYEWHLDLRDAWARQRENKIYGWLIRATSKMVHYLGSSLSFFRDVIAHVIISAVEKNIGENQAKNNPNFDSDPTHTQLAKDSVEHPLNPLAGTLAIEAVQDVGQRMLQCWAGRQEVSDLIDRASERYFVHPCQSDWADQTITNWAKANTKKLNGLEHGQSHHESHEQPKKPDFNKYQNERSTLKYPPPVD